MYPFTLKSHWFIVSFKKSLLKFTLIVLEIQSVNCFRSMHAFYVGIDVRSMFPNILAMRTLKSRGFATLVSQMSKKTSVPLVGFAAV